MVEWKKLGEVCQIKTGKLNANEQVENGLYPFFTCDMNPYRIDTYAFDCEALLLAGNGNIGSVKHYIGKFNAYQRTYVLTNFRFIETRLLFHFLNSFFKPYIEAKLKKGSVPYITLPLLSEFQIPVPSITEQQRIVEQLDTFTSSIENLKEQIAQRRKQYEYYRDQLLDLEGKEGVEMKTLGEIGEFVRGNGIQKNDFVEDGFGCIHYGQIHARYGFSAEETISKIEESLYKKCKKAQKGDVVLATTSEDAEGVAKPFVWLGDEEVAVSGDAFIFHHNQNGKFMGHQFLTHNFMQFKVKYATGAKVVRLSGENMAKYEVALPSLSEQQRIVSILDTFEASINNLEQQLAQREKQYEYYRNKLLTFE
jgi:type I restriction enzyme S subunit